MHPNAEFKEPLSRKLTLDNPHLYLGEKIYLWTRIIAPFIGFAFIGTILFFSTYAILFFFKDLYISYMRSEDRSFLYKYVTLKPHLEHILYLTVIILTFWGVVFFLEWRSFIISSGFSIFITGYILIFINYYFIENNEFDYFDNEDEIFL